MVARILGLVLRIDGHWVSLAPMNAGVHADPVQSGVGAPSSLLRSFGSGLASGPLRKLELAPAAVELEKTAYRAGLTANNEP